MKIRLGNYFMTELTGFANGFDVKHGREKLRTQYFAEFG
jgi:hypothetical protein